jgi:agmatine deiminase
MATCSHVGADKRWRACKERKPVPNAVTPASLVVGHYRMPAEWECHAATYLAWPHNTETWAETLEAARLAMAQIVAALSNSEPVRILVTDEQTEEDATAMLRQVGAIMQRVELLRIPTNDSWMRDFGPIFVNRITPRSELPAQIALNWRFNAWGGKYPPWDLDDAVPDRLAERYGFPVCDLDFVLEGGSIEVNGSGVLLTTEACLLNPNRNGLLANKATAERFLRDYLGAETILWLDGQIAGDDTDGHIDQLARFTAPGHIVAMVENDPADENYHPLKDNLERLSAMRDRCDARFEITPLPMPQPLYYRGARLPASYANFYVANRSVLVPTFNCVNDSIALDTLAHLFPQRKVMPIGAAALAIGLGTIHCLTQQHPVP